MLKKWSIIGIGLLLILTSVSTLVNSYKLISSEKDEIFDRLAFVYYDEEDSFKFNYYNEFLHRDKLDNSNLEKKSEPINPLQTSELSGQLDSPWPMFCHDLHHTSRSPYSTVNVNDLEKWRFKTGGWIEAGLAIGGDDTIYFGSFDTYFYALYLNGTLKWKYETGDWIQSTPAIAEDGTIYFGSWDYKLYALYPNGTIRWKFKVSDVISSSPAIGEDGTIYIGVLGPGADKGRLHAVNPNGTEKWHYDTGYWISSDPAIGDDGTIYVGSADNYLYALYSNGTLRWRFKTGDVIKGSPSIADDGTIYIGSYDDYLYAIYSNGTLRWKCKIGKGTETNPSIAIDGTVYVGGDYLYAIYPNGTKRWRLHLGSGRHIHMSSPAISSEGTIYIGTNIGETSGGDIIAINPNGTEKWRKQIAYKWVDSSPAIDKEGTVYIGCATDVGGYLHAFGPVESNSPPETPTISGEINGEVREEYEYKLNVVDPDNNPISFYIDWGDGTKGWMLERASGENCYYEHTWLIRGKYTIRCKAKDTLGEESDWAYLEVTMPKSQNVYLGYLERFPIMQKILDVLRLNIREKSF